MERQGVEGSMGGHLEGGAEVCGYCKVGIGLRKGSERWNDSTKEVVEEEEKIV